LTSISINVVSSILQNTENGKKWLVTCLDPFHDYQQTIEGFPDMCGQPSVCQMLNTSVTIAAPGAANWDCNVCFTGLDMDNYNSATIIPAATPPGGGATIVVPFSGVAIPGQYEIAPLTIVSAASGTPCDVISNNTNKSLLYTRSNHRTPGRLVAVAYEVHNTTADINKQGAVTTGMNPCIRTDSSTIIYKDTDVAAKPAQTGGLSFVQCDWCCALPGTAEAVRRIPTSCQWDARDGVYAIPRLNTEHVVSKPSNTDGSSIGWFHDLAGASMSPWVLEPYDTYVNALGASSTTYQFARPVISSFSPMSSYFTGLSPSTTLTITLRAVVEYFPTAHDELIQIATPSAEYDPEVLTAYNKAIKLAPYAVPVGMNAGGKYFRMCMSAISKVAPTVAKLISAPYPGAGVIVEGAGRFAKQLEQRSARRNAPPPPPVKRIPTIRYKVTNKVERKAAGASANPIKRS